MPRLGTARGVVVATYREPDAGSDAVVGAQLSPGASATSVTLSGFRREELGQLLSRLSGEPANARLVEWLHAQTAGNPYFAQELLRLLRSRGLTDDREPPERLSLPESIGNVLRARLAMLPAEATDMLAQAAVLGQEFDLATLRALSGISWHALADMLNGAVQAWVLLPIQGRSDRYGFVHALMRETLYDELPERRRAALHLRAGQALEQGASGGSSDVDQLAEHFLRAGPDRDPDVPCDMRNRRVKRRLRDWVMTKRLRTSGVPWMPNAASMIRRAGLSFCSSLAMRMSGPGIGPAL